MEKNSLKEFVTFKDKGLIKDRLAAFGKSLSRFISIAETSSEIEICYELFTVYIILDEKKGADILQIPAKRITCYRVIFYFLDKLLFAKELSKFKEIEDFLISFSEVELFEIIKSMPLIDNFSSEIKDSNLKDFALIWRDHFLEENIPLLNGFQRLGIDSKWIFPIAKGDRTIKRDRIAAYFREHDYYEPETLPNLNSESDSAKEEAIEVVDKVTQFVFAARNCGKKIMIIDDGGIIANYFKDQQYYFDCGLEVTIIGIRRLEKMKRLTIPIYNLGMSELKEIITYPEIAESCVKRIKELIPGEKLIGRRILILGYGTAGKHIARIFRNMGAYVGIVEIDYFRLVEAAENGFVTFKNPTHGINSIKPFLIVGCTGEVSLRYQDFQLLADGTYVTGIATKDLEDIRNSPNNYTSEWLPETGYIHRLHSDKYFIQLGDGQSINLYESEAIPNRANDIFKTAILIAASELASSYKTLEGGLYLERVNEVIKKSKLFEKYYELYFQ